MGNFSESVGGGSKALEELFDLIETMHPFYGVEPSYMEKIDIGVLMERYEWILRDHIYSLSLKPLVNEKDKFLFLCGLSGLNPNYNPGYTDEREDGSIYSGRTTKISEKLALFEFEFLHNLGYII